MKKNWKMFTVILHLPLQIEDVPPANGIKMCHHKVLYFKSMGEFREDSSLLGMSINMALEEIYLCI